MVAKVGAGVVRCLSTLHYLSYLCGAEDMYPESSCTSSCRALFQTFPTCLQSKSTWTMPATHAFIFQLTLGLKMARCNSISATCFSIYHNLSPPSLPPVRNYCLGGFSLWLWEVPAAQTDPYYCHAVKALPIGCGQCSDLWLKDGQSFRQPLQLCLVLQIFYPNLVIVSVMSGALLPCWEQNLGK